METYINKPDVNEDEALFSINPEEFGQFKDFCRNELAELMNALSEKADYLQVETDDFSLEMKKSKTSNKDQKHTKRKTTVEGDSKTSEEPEIIPVNSGFLGILRLTDEKKTPYAKINQQVKRGQTLAFIETMNIKNQIKSPIDGVILEIFEKDGEAVEYGQTLFLMASI